MPVERAERLRKLGLVPTIQRSAVLKYLEECGGHPTVEDVHRAVTRRHPSIARATVYNVLDALKRAGAVKELTVDREASRYEINPKPHHHFQCRACGELFDVAFPSAVKPGDEIDGHLVEAIHTVLYGICAACQRTSGHTE